MKLYLIRHAIAEDEPRDEDHLRPLTDEGREKFEQAVDGLDALGVRIDKLLYSPWLRAVETAELLSKLVTGETQVCAGLAEAPARAVLAELKGDPVALVGHQPWLTELLALLVHGSTAEGARYELKKGGVAVLEGDPRPGAMVLQQLWAPKVLRKLAR